MVFSSSSAVAETRYRMEMTHFLKWQLVWLAISVPVLMFFKRINYARLQTAQWAFGALGVVVFLQVIAVFVDRGNGFFEPRQVKTGERNGDRIQILSGLSAGERIVTSGNFLIDSESQM